MADNIGALRGPLSRFAPNVRAGVLSRVIQVLVSLWLTGFVVRSLGAEEWSLVVVATSTASVLSLLQVGAALGIAKRLTCMAAEQRWSEYERYYTASEVLGLALVAAVGIALLLLLGPGWSLLGISDARAHEARVVIALASIPVASSFGQLAALGAIQSAHRIDVIAGSTTRAFVARAVVMVLMLSFAAPRAWVYVLVLAAESLLLFALIRISARKLAPAARLTFTRRVWSDVRSVALFNSALAFNSVIYVLFLQAPVLFLQRLGATQALSGYGILLHINNAGRALLLPGTNALGPLANAFATMKDRSQLRTLFVRSSEFYLLGALVLATWLTAFRSDFLHLWLGEPSPQLVEAMPAFAVATLLGIAAMPAAVVSTALEELRAPAVAGVLLLSATIASLWWVPTAVPLLGTTTALAAGFGAYQLVRIVIVSYRLNLSAARVVGGIGTRPAVVALAALLGFVGVKALTRTHLEAVAIGTVGGGLLMVGAAAVLLPANERQWVFQKVAALRSVIPFRSK